MIDSDFLGADFFKADRLLKKMILFSLVVETDRDTCYRCGLKIESEKELSIDHKVSWRKSESPKELFYSLDNIAFSHLSCNAGASVKPKPPRKTHCPHGHEYTEENLFYTRKGSSIACKECLRLRNKKRKRRKAPVAQLD